MTTYYKLTNGQIEMATQNKSVAERIGCDQQTEREIKHGWDGRLYFADALPIPPEPTYAEKRVAEYPALAEQLDMIYWDRVNGTSLWQDTITEIKAKYPKE